MPEIPALYIVLPAAALLAGTVVGWYARARRAAADQAVVRAGYEEQLDACRAEHDRLLADHRDLASRAGEYEAACRDATGRARELASALKEAYRRRDELRRQVNDASSQLESALADRRRLESEMQSLSSDDRSRAAALREKNEKIFRLSRELGTWQERLPPLLRRYRDRDDDAKRLESALDRANERLLELEAGRAAGHTHVESTRRDAATDAMDASNDALARTGRFVAPAGTRASVLAAAAGFDGLCNDPAQDDLQAIKGVGPAIEKLLHELGIFRYSQIAEMNEYDINRIADRLKGFRTRIHRENWIGQARELQLRRRAH